MRWEAETILKLWQELKRWSSLVREQIHVIMASFTSHSRRVSLQFFFKSKSLSEERGGFSYCWLCWLCICTEVLKLTKYYWHQRRYHSQNRQVSSSAADSQSQLWTTRLAFDVLKMNHRSLEASKADKIWHSLRIAKARCMSSDEMQISYWPLLKAALFPSSSCGQRQRQRQISKWIL